MGSEWIVGTCFVAYLLVAAGFFGYFCADTKDKDVGGDTLLVCSLLWPLLVAANIGDSLHKKLNAPAKGGTD